MRTIEEIHADGFLPVELMNPQDMPSHSASVIEKQPGHYAAISFLLPVPGPITEPGLDANLNTPTQILALDPLRDEAAISVNGIGQVFFCHSEQAAQRAQIGQQTPSDGFLVTSPFAFRIHGTAPLWAVPVAASAFSGLAVSTVGTITSPGIGVAVATLNSANLLASAPIGTIWNISWAVTLGGTIAAGDANNMELSIPLGTAVEQGLFPGTVGGPYAQTPTTGKPAASQNIVVQTIAAASVGAVYTAQIVATPQGVQQQQTITVGVLAERMGH